MPAAGLRERKKQRTREAIVDAAFRLFAERGYDATTIADIAAEAEIGARTFFGYFPTKEAVVFFDKDEHLEALRRRLDARTDEESAFDVMCSWVQDLVGRVDWEDERERTRRRLIRDTPSVREHERAALAGFEEVLGAAIAEDLGVPASALRPRLIAAAGTASLSALSAFRHEERRSESSRVAGVAETLAFLRGGVAALEAS